MDPNSSTLSRPFPHPSNDSHPPVFCFGFKPWRYFFIAFCIVTIFLFLPIYIFILHHGLREWRRKFYSSSSAVMSHFDCFTYHMVVMEMIHTFGCVLLCCGLCADKWGVVDTAIVCWSITLYGGLFFHVLTCVERHLAAVHAVVYLKLRSEKWVRVRNATAVSVWLLCGVTTGLTDTDYIDMVESFLSTSSITCIFFCCVSVLCVLVRPGPGGRGGTREDQSKKRAFYTMTAILGALLLRFMTNLCWNFVHMLNGDLMCVVSVCEVWAGIPSSLVLPLLFLHRKGKLK